MEKQPQADSSQKSPVPKPSPHKTTEDTKQPDIKGITNGSPVNSKLESSSTLPSSTYQEVKTCKPETASDKKPESADISRKNDHVSNGTTKSEDSSPQPIISVDIQKSMPYDDKAVVPDDSKKDVDVPPEVLASVVTTAVVNEAALTVSESEGKVVNGIKISSDSRKVEEIVKQELSKIQDSKNGKSDKKCVDKSSGESKLLLNGDIDHSPEKEIFEKMSLKSEKDSTSKVMENNVTTDVKDSISKESIKDSSSIATDVGSCNGVPGIITVETITKKDVSSNGKDNTQSLLTDSNDSKVSYVASVDKDGGKKDSNKPETENILCSGKIEDAKTEESKKSTDIADFSEDKIKSMESDTIASGVITSTKNIVEANLTDSAKLLKDSLTDSVRIQSKEEVTKDPLVKPSEAEVTSKPDSNAKLTSQDTSSMKSATVLQNSTDESKSSKNEKVDQAKETKQTSETKDIDDKGALKTIELPVKKDNVSKTEYVCESVKDSKISESNNVLETKSDMPSRAIDKTKVEEKTMEVSSKTVKEVNVIPKEKDKLDTSDKNVSDKSSEVHAKISPKSSIDNEKSNNVLSQAPITDSSNDLLDASKDKLDASKDKLDASKNKLDASKDKLNDSKDKLDDYKDKLDDYKDKLDDYKDKLYDYKDKLDDPKDKLDASKDELGDSKDKIDSSKDKIDASKDKLGDSKDKIDSSKHKIDSSKDKIDSSKDKIDVSKDKLDSFKDTLEASKGTLERSKDKLYSSKDKLDATKSEEVYDMTAMMTSQILTKEMLEADDENNGLQEELTSVSEKVEADITDKSSIKDSDVKKESPVFETCRISASRVSPETCDVGVGHDEKRMARVAAGDGGDEEVDGQQATTEVEVTEDSLTAHPAEETETESLVPSDAASPISGSPTSDRAPSSTKAASPPSSKSSSAASKKGEDSAKEEGSKPPSAASRSSIPEPIVYEPPERRKSATSVAGEEKKDVEVDKSRRDEREFEKSAGSEKDGEEIVEEKEVPTEKEQVSTSEDKTQQETVCLETEVDNIKNNAPDTKEQKEEEKHTEIEKGEEEKHVEIEKGEEDAKEKEETETKYEESKETESLSQGENNLQPEESSDLKALKESEKSLETPVAEKNETDADAQNMKVDSEKEHVEEGTVQKTDETESAVGEKEKEEEEEKCIENESESNVKNEDVNLDIGETEKDSKESDEKVEETEKTEKEKKKVVEEPATLVEEESKTESSEKEASGPEEKEEDEAEATLDEGEAKKEDKGDKGPEEGEIAEDETQKESETEAIEEAETVKIEEQEGETVQEEDNEENPAQDVETTEEPQEQDVKEDEAEEVELKEELVVGKEGETTDEPEKQDVGKDESEEKPESPPKSPTKRMRSPDKSGRRGVSPLSSPPKPLKTPPSPQKPQKSTSPKKKNGMLSPIKTPKTPGSDGRKLPPIKAPVGIAPNPNLKNIRSKIGSFDNIRYKPGGGDKKVISKKLEWKAAPKIGSLDHSFKGEKKQGKSLSKGESKDAKLADGQSPLPSGDEGEQDGTSAAVAETLINPEGGPSTEMPTAIAAES